MPVTTVASAAPTLGADMVTGTAGGAPAGCRADDIGRRLVALFETINRGDAQIVPAFFDAQTGEPFQWYAMNAPDDAPTPSFVAYTTADLAQYMTQRYAQHEQLQLVRVQINSWDAPRQLVHFGPLLVTRQADDLHPLAWHADGKGAYNCAAHKFVVLSMGMY